MTSRISNIKEKTNNLSMDIIFINIVKIGEKRDFVQILGLKTPISVDRNFEHLTSEGSVTRNFEISSSLTPSLQNMDIDGPN